MRRSIGILGMAALALFGGCGKSGAGPETARVSGTLYLDGTPAADVDVHFMNGSYSVFARTDSDGKYELVSGAAVGENKIYFSKITCPKLGTSPELGLDEGQLMAMRDPGIHPSRMPEQVIPEEYSNPTKTKISFLVPSRGATGADFDLSTMENFLSETTR